MEVYVVLFCPVLVSFAADYCRSSLPFVSLSKFARSACRPYHACFRVSDFILSVATSLVAYDAVLFCCCCCRFCCLLFKFTLYAVNLVRCVDDGTCLPKCTLRANKVASLSLLQPLRRCARPALRLITFYFVLCRKDARSVRKDIATLKRNGEEGQLSARKTVFKFKARIDRMHKLYVQSEVVKGRNLVTYAGARHQPGIVSTVCVASWGS